MAVAPEPSPEQNDPVLGPFLLATSEEAARSLLSELIAEHVRPVARDIAFSRLRSASDAPDGLAEVDDIGSEVVVQLVERLRDLRNHECSVPVANLRAYVASTTQNLLNHHVRQKYPERSRLKNRLRYVLNHEPGLALWQHPSGAWLCGLRQWAATSLAPRSIADLEQFEQQLRHQIDIRKVDLRQLLEALFQLSGQPLEVDQLVDLTAKVMGIRDVRRIEIEDDEKGEAWNSLPDHRVDIASEIEQRSYLDSLWHEICELRPNQRVAVLLNLRDRSGQDMLPLFALTGVASLRQVADALEMPMDKFAQVWNRLPLDDATIAARLGVTRQQVINLRKSARERLSRRMANRWWGTGKKYAGR